VKLVAGQDRAARSDRWPRRHLLLLVAARVSYLRPNSFALARIPLHDAIKKNRIVRHSYYLFHKRRYIGVAYFDMDNLAATRPAKGHMYQQFL
jgi:hypothetical protein